VMRSSTVPSNRAVNCPLSDRNSPASTSNL
jgi:hypothetical protein